MRILILEVNILIVLLFKRIKGAESTLSFKSKSESEVILYYSSSSSSSSLLELLNKESLSFNSLLNNSKSKKLNKILFIIRIDR
jgi:hypothetical protein